MMLYDSENDSEYDSDDDKYDAVFWDLFLTEQDEFEAANRQLQDVLVGVDENGFLELCFSADPYKLDENWYLGLESELLCEAISQLSPDERYLLYLRYFLDFTQSNIAKVTDMRDISKKLTSILNKLKENIA